MFSGERAFKQQKEFEKVYKILEKISIFEKFEADNFRLTGTNYYLDIDEILYWGFCWQYFEYNHIHKLVSIEHILKCHSVSKEVKKKLLFYLDLFTIDYNQENRRKILESK